MSSQKSAHNISCYFKISQYSVHHLYYIRHDFIDLLMINHSDQIGDKKYIIYLSQDTYTLQETAGRYLAPFKNGNESSRFGRWTPIGVDIDVLSLRLSPKSYVTPYYQLSAIYFRNIAINT